MLNKIPLSEKRLRYASSARSLAFRLFERFTFVFILFAMALGASTVAAQSVVYDAVPGTLAPNYASLGFQATSTFQIGDYVHLAGTNRVANTVTITMSNWALESTPGNVSYCAGAAPGTCTPAGFNHPFTLNIHAIGGPLPGGVRDKGALLASVTQTKLVPWRPEADPTCPNPTAWRVSPTVCANGYAFNLTFDLSSLNTVLPNDVIVGLVFNTQTYGLAPMGVDGPYNSLNVALGTAAGATVGTDDNINNIFWHTSHAPFYTDAGAAGLSFREDTNWGPGFGDYGTIPIQITATPIVHVVDEDGFASATDCDAGSVSFSTIQNGINAAATGDVVKVCPGTYAENVNVNKSVSVSGAGDGSNPAIDTIIGPASGAAVTVSANDVSLSGLRVTSGGVGNGLNLGHLTNLAIDDLTAINNSVGLRTGNGTIINGLTVTNSHFDGNVNQGWYLSEHPASGGMVTNVQVSNTTFNDNLNKGIYAEKLDNAVFNGITVNNSGTVGTNHTAGIDINLKWANYSNIQILNSTITNNGGIDPNGGGILIKARSTGSYASPAATLDGVVLRGLLVSGNGGGTYGAGIRIGESNNSFTGIDAGPTNVDISFSRIVGNPVHGVRNATAASTVMAENNWWGCNYGPNGASGPGCTSVTDSVAGTVEFDPWLVMTPTPPVAATTVGVPIAVYTNLWNNSDGGTPAGGFVPNGTPSLWATDFGTLTPQLVTTSGQTGTFISSAAPGVANLSTTIDGQTVSRQVFVYTTACSNVSMPVQTSLTGQPISVPVNTTEMIGRGAISTDFTVTFNNSVIIPNGNAGNNWGVTLGSVGNSNGGGRELTVERPSAGTLVISIFGTTEFQGSGALVNLNFNVVGLPGTSSAVAFGPFMYNEETFCGTKTNGSVTVVSGTISGTVTYGNALVGPADKRVPGATLNATGSLPVASATTGNDGSYVLSGMGSGAYTVTPSKTADTQGAISGYDASAIAVHVTGGTPLLTGNQLVVADVSGSTTITSYDAALIATFVANLPGSGSTGTWIFSPTSVYYASVFANIPNQNYSALLMGDVTGNWAHPDGNPALTFEPEGDALMIAAGKVSGSSGTTLSVPVTIGNTTGLGIRAYEFDLYYDSDVIEPATAAAELAEVSNGRVLTINATKKGMLRVVVFGALPLEGGGELLRLNFNVIGAADSTSVLRWENVRLNEGGIKFQADNGEVNVLAAAESGSINGRLLDPRGTGVGRTRVTVTDTEGNKRSVMTSTLGYFQVSELKVGGTYTVTAESRRYRFAAQPVSITDGNAVQLVMTGLE